MLRVSVAERVMEETLALPFEGMGDRTLRVAADEAGGRQGWTAQIQVEARGGNLKEVVVTVRDGQHETQLRTLATRWRVES
jgi:hypothetical protein